MDDPLEPVNDLTPAGSRRREVILRAAVAAAVRRRRRRTAGRAAGAAAAVAALAAGTWSVLAPPGPGTPGENVAVRDGEPTPPATGPTRPAVPPVPLVPAPGTPAPETPVPRDPIVITRVATDRTLVDQWAVRGDPADVERLDDQGLGRALAAAGLAGGVVVRDGGRPELWWQPVATNAKPAGAGHDF